MPSLVATTTVGHLFISTVLTVFVFEPFKSDNCSATSPKYICEKVMMSDDNQIFSLRTEIRDKLTLNGTVNVVLGFLSPPV